MKHPPAIILTINTGIKQVHTAKLRPVIMLMTNTATKRVRSKPIYQAGQPNMINTVTKSGVLNDNCYCVGIL